MSNIANEYTSTSGIASATSDDRRALRKNKTCFPCMFSPHPVYFTRVSLQATIDKKTLNKAAKQRIDVKKSACLTEHSEQSVPKQTILRRQSRLDRDRKNEEETEKSERSCTNDAGAPCHMRHAWPSQSVVEKRVPGER